MNNIYEQWLQAKETEQIAIKLRRELEDMMIADFRISEMLDGTDKRTVGNFEVKIVGRLNKKIDSDLVQEIAAEHGIEHQLPVLFRWKAEIESKAWKQADAAVVNLFNAAITTSASRPSFSITTKE